jgi:hypothetical protein
MRTGSSVRSVGSLASDRRQFRFRDIPLWGAAPPSRPEQVEQHRAAEAKMRRAGVFGHHLPRDKEHHLASRKCRRESTPRTSTVSAADLAIVVDDPVAR